MNFKEFQLIRFAFSIVLSFTLLGCASKRGNIIAVRNFPSPDGRYECTVFGEIFYNTTGYPQHVHLRRAGEHLGYLGNVYIAPVGEDVAVSWTSPTNLSVRLSFETRHNIPASTNVAGVTVTFSEMTR